MIIKSMCEKTIDISTGKVLEYTIAGIGQKIPFTVVPGSVIMIKHRRYIVQDIQEDEVHHRFFGKVWIHRYIVDELNTQIPDTITFNPYYEEKQSPDTKISNPYYEEKQS